MKNVLVVGSGASGVHFALTLLERGHRVTMVDVGLDGEPAPNPKSGLDDLKESLHDPVDYFLGSRMEGVVLPDLNAEFYGIPPGKSYVLRQPSHFGFEAEGFAPLFSFAQGGLAEVWTGGCYPLNDAELSEFAFSYADLEPYYSEVSRRIGITGAQDDLTRFFPVHGYLLPDLRLDEHSESLLASYTSKRSFLQQKLGFFLGRTRVATLSRDLGSRKACDYLGRCLWGCPLDSLYVPTATLRQCMDYETFSYVPGFRALHFLIDENRRVTKLIGQDAAGQKERELEVEYLALAAGTLCSSEIILRSNFLATGELLRLGGLMDNRQVLVPYLNLKLLGETASSENYQYHLLGMGLVGESPRDYVHGQITTLTTAMMHPIVQNLPFDMITSSFVSRVSRAALGIVNVNFSDSRREENYLTLSPNDEGTGTQLSIHYSPLQEEERRIAPALRRVKKALRHLGCIVPPGMSHTRPMGASVHYCGTVPMSRSPGPWTTTELCQSREFENLYLVDGSTFPDLPAKNLTFTLMANAVRVAEQAF